MRLFLSTLCFLLVFIDAADASKFYKVVDENGKVTYSQFPPKTDKSKQQNNRVERFSLDQDQQAMSSISTVDDEKFCGEIILPKKMINQKNSTNVFLETVNTSKKEWERDLASLKKTISSSDKYRADDAEFYSRYASRRLNSDSLYSEEYKINVKKMRDYHCAIHWAASIQDNARHYIDSYRKERINLRADYHTANERLVKKCGSEPLLDPTDPLNAYSRKVWLRCGKDYLEEMEVIQGRIDRL